MAVRPSLYLSLLPLCAVASACAPDFSSFNQVDKLRVLGIRAEPPDLRFEDETLLDALVEGEVDSYEWSWCPFGFSDTFTGECPVDEDEFRALLAEAGAEEDPPPFALGNESTQSYQHLIQPIFLDQLCAQIGMIELPEGFEQPACDGRFDINIRLKVSGPDGELVSTRRLSLIYQANLEPNQNPRILGGELSVRGAPPFPFSDDAPAIVARDVEYAVEVDVDEDSIETYPDFDDRNAENVERLAITWFYEAGEMDKSRSSFIEDFVSFENLQQNSYRTPTEEEQPDERTKLYFVIRDERGGLNWLVTELELSL